MKARALALALLLLPAATAGQFPTDGIVARQSPTPVVQPIPTGPASLTGKAIDRESGAPLPDSRVVVRLLGPQTGGSSFEFTPYGRVFATDSEGAFVVSGVPYGNYVVEIMRDGYGDADAFVPGVSRRSMQVTDTAPVANETFPMSRLGALEGTVVDDAGQPQADQAVVLYRERKGFGPLALPELARAATNRHGVFRFTHVPQGNYVVGLDFRVTTMPMSLIERGKALSSADVASMDRRLAELQLPRVIFSAPGVTLGDFLVVVEDGARRPSRVDVLDGRVITTASTYAPGVTSFAEAVKHTVQVGQQLTGVTITVRKRPGTRVSGTLKGPFGSTAEVGLRLIAEGADHIGRGPVGDAALTVTDVNGRFSFLGVPPGRYDLEVTVLVEPKVRTASAMRPELQYWAKAEVDTTTGDVEDLSVALNEPLVVRGRMVFVTPGSEGDPKPVQGGIRVSLQPRSGQQATLPQAATFADGTFVLGPALPGPYEFSVNVGAPWRVLSIVSEGRDIAGQVIELNRSLDDVVITLTRADRGSWQH